MEKNIKTEEIKEEKINLDVEKEVVEDIVDDIEETSDKKEMDDATQDIKSELEHLTKSAKKLAKATSKIAEKKTKKAVEKAKVEVEKAKVEAKKTSKKVADLFKNTSVHTYIQVDEKEIDESEIIARIKELHNNNSEEKVKTLNLYVKPKENKVYYVVNGSIFGELVIFE